VGFKTWVAGDVLTASDVNAFLMKQAVIVCTSGTRPSGPVEGMTIYQTDTDTLVMYDGTNWERYLGRPVIATVATSEGTATTSYTDLATSGPAVTMTTGTVAEVTLTAAISNSAANLSGMSFAVSGASTVPAADSRAVIVTGTSQMRVSVTTVMSVTAGSNVFTAKYRAAAGTATFVNRELIVRPI
jgi:hypothetical protein